MVKLQVKYCSKYDCDFGSGYEQMDEYIKEHHKLVSSDIIQYNEAIDNFMKKSLVMAKANSAHVYNNVVLNVDALEEIYKYVSR